MASESSSQSQQQITRASNVHFECDDGIIAYNKFIAFLEHQNKLYQPMLQFLSNSCISTALTKQPSAYYAEYSGNSSTLRSGLNYSKNYVSVPSKEIVRAGLETLGLVDENNPTLSSTSLRSHCLIWGLNVDIGNIIFSDFVAKFQSGKKGKEPNVCYTIFLSLMIEHLLGENYKNDELTSFNPHTISAASFEKPLASKVALTSHMLKVAKLLLEPEETFILPFGGVNVDDTNDKSLFGTAVQRVTQSKAPTDNKFKKKKTPASTKPKTSKIVRESS
ncbi:hypothetical protein Tco_1118338 [Tanacetum coccineum]